MAALKIIEHMKANLNDSLLSRNDFRLVFNISQSLFELIN